MSVGKKLVLYWTLSRVAALVCALLETVLFYYLTWAVGYVLLEVSQAEMLHTRLLWVFWLGQSYEQWKVLIHKHSV